MYLFDQASCFHFSDTCLCGLVFKQKLMCIPIHNLQCDDDSYSDKVF